MATVCVLSNQLDHERPDFAVLRQKYSIFLTVSKRWRVVIHVDDVDGQLYRSGQMVSALSDLVNGNRHVILRTSFVIQLFG